MAQEFVPQKSLVYRGALFNNTPLLNRQGYQCSGSQTGSSRTDFQNKVTAIFK